MHIIEISIFQICQWRHQSWDNDIFWNQFYRENRSKNNCELVSQTEYVAVFVFFISAKIANADTGIAWLNVGDTSACV